ncbi:MAG: SDR family oxidoreductase [Methanomicrobiales archaeon]|nr:SDR family oxidoreductase [Methanomicrobiales archaeon]
MTQQGYYQDKICIVTGANSGIGYALSAELLKRGAIVYMAGRSRAKVEDAARTLGAGTGRARPIVVDVSSQPQVQKAIEDTVSQAGRIDLLFNNAGVGGTIPYEKVTLDDWKTIIDTNLWSVIYGVHAAIPIMLKQGSGHIVNTSSVAGIVPLPFQALYATTKFGVTGMTESLRYEFADKGLHFSTICPSNIATPIFNKSIDGTSHGELRIPSDAYPVDKAAEYILDKVAQHRGIILVPPEPEPESYKKYWNENPESEAILLQMARERRAAYEKGGSYF